jgi:hypothetical protein
MVFAGLFFKQGKRVIMSIMGSWRIMGMSIGDSFVHGQYEDTIGNEVYG